MDKQCFYRCLASDRDYTFSERILNETTEKQVSIQRSLSFKVPTACELHKIQSTRDIFFAFATSRMSSGGH